MQHESFTTHVDDYVSRQILRDKENKQSLPELPWRYLLVQDSLRHPKSTISRTITVSWLQRHLPACSAFWTAGMFLCTNFDTAFEIPAEPAGHTARPHGDVTQAQHCVDVESRQLLIAGPDRFPGNKQIYPPSCPIRRMKASCV